MPFVPWIVTHLSNSSIEILQKLSVTSENYHERRFSLSMILSYYLQQDGSAQDIWNWVRGVTYLEFQKINRGQRKWIQIGMKWRGYLAVIPVCPILVNSTSLILRVPPTAMRWPPRVGAEDSMNPWMRMFLVRYPTSALMAKEWVASPTTSEKWVYVSAEFKVRVFLSLDTCVIVLNWS